MSGAQTATRDDDPPDNDEVSRIDPETERIARVNGWRPRSEYKGDIDKWIPADVFIARGIEVPAILANRNKMLAEQVNDLQRRFEASTQESNARLEDAVSTVKQMTTMMRSAEERAYARAKRELTEEMERAVEAGDTATWKRLDLQREELDKEKPVLVDPNRETRTTTQNPPPASNQQLDPAITRFFSDNSWYDPERKRADRDEEMMAFADTIHNGLRTTQPRWSMEENLRTVEAEVRKRFPEKFGRQQYNGGQNDQANGHDTGGGRSVSNTNGSGADRRDDPPAVTPSSNTGSGQRRNAANRFTFDTMPQASKDAYGRYAKLLEGKGAPLTKEEWATDYWSQYRDDGAP